MNPDQFISNHQRDADSGGCGCGCITIVLLLISIWFMLDNVLESLDAQDRKMNLIIEGLK